MTSTLCLPTHKRDESVKHPNHARGWTRSSLAYVWLVPNAPLRTRYERVTHDSSLTFSSSRIFNTHFSAFSLFTFSSIFNQPRHHCCQLIIENLLRWDTNSIKLIKFADDNYIWFCRRRTAERVLQNSRTSTTGQRETTSGWTVPKRRKS